MKKRILSLILALSMVLSVLPLGAFAEGSSGELVMGATGYPIGTQGNGWKFSDDTLTLTRGTFDFSSTHPQNPVGKPTEQTVRCEIKLEQDATITGGDFEANVTNDKGTISGGFFADGVTNSGTITGDGTFNGKVENITGGTIPGGTISGGTFYGSVTNLNTIEKGTFEGNVTNSGTISGGTFQSKCSVENYSYIENGTFEGSVTNYSYIENGTFNGSVTNDGTNATIKNGTFGGTVENSGTIENGIFNGTVENFVGTISGGTFAGSVTNKGTITSGTFNGKVTNYRGRTISGGTFKGTVNNDYGTISGGTFAAGLSKNNGSKILGGIFNGNANLTGAYHVTVTDGSVSQVNGEGPLNADGTTGTAWDLYAYAGTPMTIIASTEIFSLNGQPIAESSYGVDKKTVTFTMPDDDVVLNGAITSGELVMENGYPKDSNGGTTPCSGTGWEYSNGTLTLTSGTYDFSFTHPQNTSAGTKPAPAVQCAIEIQSGAEITDGTFSTTVNNYTGGKISGGTFQSKGMVINNGTITGGIFNGDANLNGVTGDYNITWDAAAYSGAKITEVNGVSADWKPYVVVTSNATTNEVTITADTEIFSLNGKPIGTDYNSSYPKPNDRTTVKFTMPDKNVVLNGAITCTNLVMENGWPQASKDGQISCSGTDWSYDKNTKTLTLTSGTFDFSTTQPVQCEIEIQSSRAEITGGTFAGSVTNKGTIKNGSFEQEVTNNAGGEISGGTFYGTVTNSGYIKDGTFNGKVTNRNTIENGTFAGSVTNEGTIKNGSFEKKVTNSNTIMDGVFKGVVENGGNGTIFGGTFAGSVNNSYGGHIFGGVFNGHINVPGFGVYPITVDTASSKAEIKEVNGVSAVWEPYVVVTELTKNQKVIITASTKIYSLNHKPLSTDNCNSAHDGNENTVKFTMPNANVVLNGAITSTDLVMENGWPKDSNGGKTPCKGDGWQYIPNDPTNGDMLLLTGSNQTGGLFDFSTIGDGAAVECNVFVGKPTAITGGEFNGKVFNNSDILGGTFHGEVDNMGPGRIVNGTFKNSVENNGTIEKRHL